MSEYARKRFGENSPEARQKYKLGDVNTTLIHTAKGKTIMLQYNVSTPRPYSRLQTVCGATRLCTKISGTMHCPDSHGDTCRKAKHWQY